jgi:hypothetical protein
MVANREDYLRVKSKAGPLPGNPPHGSSTVTTLLKTSNSSPGLLPVLPHERVSGLGGAMRDELERWLGVGPSADGSQQIAICI